MREYVNDVPAGKRPRRRGILPAAAAAEPGPPRRRLLDGRNTGWIVAGFLGGVLVGAVLLFAYAWSQVG